MPRSISPIMLRLADVFSGELYDDDRLEGEDCRYWLAYHSDRQELEIHVNTFIDPYTQDIPRVLGARYDKLSSFGPATCDDLENPCKISFYQIELKVSQDMVTDEWMHRLKETVDQIHLEESPYRQIVCFQTEYNGATSYFEGNLCPLRAVIKTKRGYERYDFSDERKFDEEMWDIVTGEWNPTGRTCSAPVRQLG